MYAGIISREFREVEGDIATWEDGTALASKAMIDIVKERRRYA